MNQQEYYIGIDAGTSSVGWAVTTPDYKIIKKNGKALWGVRLFDEASTAEKRRMARTARRRRGRQVYRQALLREVFKDAIMKVDPAFYHRLDESKYLEKDKEVETKYCLFADQDFNDQDYHKAYPTIYHLRKELLESNESHDVRLVYLAISHILKHRGHFLSEMSLTERRPNFEPVWNSFVENLEELRGISLECDDIEALKNLLKEKKLVLEKKKALQKLITISGDSDEKKEFPCIFELLSGKNCDLSKSFGIELEKEEKKALTISFSGDDMDNEEKLSKMQSYLEDNMQLILDLKDIYDWGILQGILDGDNSSISISKVKSYEKHKSDLALLKKAIREEGSKEEYKEMFRCTQDKLNNYCAYSGHCHFDKNTKKLEYRCAQADFYKYVKSVLKNATSEEAKLVLSEIELGKFMPKQHTKENSIIPYQLHVQELNQILDNAETYLPFLKEADESGKTVREKIESIVTYRVPYYVGPLDHSKAKEGMHWAVKKVDTRVYPWNFDEVVDKEKSAQAFMERLTNTCTYLTGESVLPKNSIFYSRYMVLNELNNVRVYGELLSVPQKQKLFNELFLGKSSVSHKDLEKYLIAEGLLNRGEPEAISGIDGDFKANLKTERRFREIFGAQLPTMEQMDDMTLSILLLKQEPEMLKNRIQKIYPSITEEQLKKVCKLTCNGWGRFSRKFLMGIKASMPETGEQPISILDALWNTQYNLMQLLSQDKPYIELVNQHNKELAGETTLNYKTVEELAVPPYVRRTVWQTLRIVKEISHIMGGEPSKIFIEMARGKEDTGRTVSRKNKLLECYRAMGEDYSHWCAEIESRDEAQFRRDALYLYYTQQGRCMYTGQKIELDVLLSAGGDETYDIDHIWPQSKVKDDSLDNRVLVMKSANQNKRDEYPIDATIQADRKAFWNQLYHSKLISKKKLDRLTRTQAFTEDELSDFISRQLVETRQSTKILAQILEQAMPDSRVVYVKAGNVSDFVHEFQKKIDYVKVRDLNDYHHAKDAYLNIVVGNGYDVKFTANPRYFVARNEKYSIKTKTMFEHPIQRGGNVAWDPDTGFEAVKHTLHKNNIFVTRQAVRYNSGTKGGLFAQNPVKGKEGLTPLKGDPRLANTLQYGGYNKDTSAYMFLVEHKKKKKTIRSLETVYLRFAKKIDEDPDYLLTYCEEFLKLSELKIIVPEIKLNTLLKANGFAFYLTGRSGESVLGKQAFQLVLSPELKLYLKAVLSVTRRVKAAFGEIQITEKDRVSAEKNLELYDAFLQKMQVSVYSSRPSSQIKTLTNSREQFMALDLKDQCMVLENILHLFRNNGQVDLKIIGGRAGVGKIILSKNFSQEDELKMIVTSPTGFYQQEIDLLQP